eukprot:11207599-Lingulodinium_polyedra.AAC.1
MASIGSERARVQVHTRIKAKNPHHCPISQTLESIFGRRILETVIAKLCRAMLAKSHMHIEPARSRARWRITG